MSLSTLPAVTVNPTGEPILPGQNLGNPGSNVNPNAALQTQGLNTPADVATKYNIAPASSAGIGTSDPVRQQEQQTYDTANQNHVQYQQQQQNPTPDPRQAALDASLQSLKDSDAAQSKTITDRQAALADEAKANEASINGTYDRQLQTLQTSQANETGSYTNNLARIGGYLGNSASSAGALVNLNHAHELALSDLESKRADAIQAARAGASSKNFELTKLLNQNVTDLNKAIADQKDKFFTQSHMLMQEEISKQTEARQTTAANQTSTDAIIKNIAPIIYSQFKGQLDSPQAQAFIKNTAKEYGLDPNQLSGHTQDYSNTQNLNQLKAQTSTMKDFTYAVQNSGYTGSFTDYQNFQANLRAKSSAYSNAMDNLGDISTYAGTTVSGKSYIDGSQFKGTELAVAHAEAQQLGIPFLDVNQKEGIDNIDKARLNTQSIASYIQGILPTDASGRVVGAPGNLISQFVQSNDQKAAFGNFSTDAINAIKALAGTKGLRINQTEINGAIDNFIPKITDTLGTAQQKLKNLNGFLNNSENIITTKDRSTLKGADLVNGGSVGGGSTQQLTGPDGKSYNVPNDKVDAFIKAGGKKI